MKLRTFIVDDEPMARARIRLLLQNEADFEVIREYASGSSALAAIQTELPDLVFLDVEMPGQDGFDVLQALPGERRPLIIFATGHRCHAWRAFDAHAFD